MQQQAAGRRRGHHRESVTSYQKSTPSVGGIIAGIGPEVFQFEKSILSFIQIYIHSTIEGLE